MKAFLNKEREEEKYVIIFFQRNILLIILEFHKINLNHTHFSLHTAGRFWAGYWAVECINHLIMCYILYEQDQHARQDIPTDAIV